MTEKEKDKDRRDQNAKKETNRKDINKWSDREKSMGLKLKSA